MSGRVNSGTIHERWALTREPYKANVEVRRDFGPTVTVGISSNGYGMRHELSPDEAREMAAALFDLANRADFWEADSKPIRNSSTERQS